MTPEAVGTRRLEICLEDIGGTSVAASCGADRVEVCSRLDVGGLTPEPALVVDALLAASGSQRFGLQLLIRCRAGDFVHTPAEITVMVEQIRSLHELARTHGLHDRLGFVVGTLTSHGLVDGAAVEAYAGAADGAPLTFHKAFDDIEDRSGALEVLIAAGVERVLTSGGAPTAPSGADGIRALVTQTHGRIDILAGGGVRPGNLAELLRHTGVREVHLRAQDQTGRTDADVVRRMRDLLDVT